MKNLDYYLNLNYPITIDKFEDYNSKIKYVAEISDLPGCSAQAEKLEDALTKLEDAKISWIEVSLARNLEIPEPVTEDKFSGKFLLRIPVKLHKQLSMKANRESLSLNQFIRVALERYLEHDLLAIKIENLERTQKSLIAMVSKSKFMTESDYMKITGEDQNPNLTIPFPYGKASVGSEIGKEKYMATTMQ